MQRRAETIREPAAVASHPGGGALYTVGGYLPHPGAFRRRESRQPEPSVPSQKSGTYPVEGSSFLARRFDDEYPEYSEEKEHGQGRRDPARCYHDFWDGTLAPLMSPRTFRLAFAS